MCILIIALAILTLGLFVLRRVKWLAVGGGHAVESTEISDSEKILETTSQMADGGGIGTQLEEQSIVELAGWLDGEVEKVEMNNLLNEECELRWSDTESAESVEETDEELSPAVARVRWLESENHLLRLANANNADNLEVVEATQARLTVILSKNVFGPMRTEAVKFGTIGVDECEASVSIFIDRNKYTCNAFDCRLHLRSLSGRSLDVVVSLELETSCEIPYVGRLSDRAEFWKYFPRRSSKFGPSEWTERLVLIGGAGTQTGMLQRGYFTDQMEYALDRDCLVKIVFLLSVRSQPVSLPEGETILVEDKAISICPSLLSSWSKFWRVQFSPDWQKDVYYVNDPGISYDEYLEMLFVISSIEKPVDEFNFVSLLKIADRFEMPGLTAKVERFLINFGGHSISFSRLFKVAADDFDLPLLRAVLLDRWKKPLRMLDELLTDRSFEELSQRAKNLAYERFSTAHVRLSGGGTRRGCVDSVAEEEDW